MKAYFVSEEGFVFRRLRMTDMACLYSVKFFEERHYEVFRNTGTYPDNDKIFIFNDYENALKMFERL